MKHADVIIVGGGIAGLAVAYHLTSCGVRRVVLFEREPLLASHSSGRNAAIFRPLDSSPDIITLAKRSRELLDALFDSEPDHWLRPTGLLLVAPEATLLAEQRALARESGLLHEVLREEEILSLVALLKGGDARNGLFLPDAGVMDIHAMTTVLAREAKAAGAQILTGAEVKGALVEGGRVRGVRLSDGGAITSEIVVIAAGAWAAGLGATCDAELPFTPLRRHLVHLEVELRDPIPAVWCLGDEVYFRPESGGILASPCDEEPWPPELPPTGDIALDQLARKLARLAPSLACGAVRRAWACLRTSAPDRVPVAGEDPRVRGLFWLSGLGGYGMTIGMAMGEVMAALVSGAHHAMASILTPARLLANSDR